MDISFSDFLNELSFEQIDTQKLSSDTNYMDKQQICDLIETKKVKSYILNGITESDSDAVMEISFSDFVQEITVEESGNQKLIHEDAIFYPPSTQTNFDQQDPSNVTKTENERDVPQQNRIEAKGAKRSHKIKTEKRTNTLYKRRRVEEDEPTQEEIDIILSCYSSKNVTDCPIKVQECLTVLTNDHVTQNTGPKPTYCCHICDQCFIDDFSAFYSHLKCHNVDLNESVELGDEGRQKRVPCTICNYIVLSSDLKQHMAMHIDHTRCSFCHEFVLHNDFVEHMEGHTRHFKCAICHAMFKTRPDLNAHLSKHKNHVEYKCDQCDLRFIGLATMIGHRSLTHMSLDPFYSECPFCFKLTNVYNDHIYNVYICRVKCPICKRRLRNKKEYESHVKGHTKLRKRKINKY